MDIPDFGYQNNKIKFWAITGTVLNSEKRSHTDTYTSTSGGGGYIHQGTGYVNAPRTTTRTVTTHTHEFWLAKDDGTEQCIKLINADVPLREGQRITMIWAAREGNKNLWSWVHLVNHSANRYWNLLNEKEFVQKFIKRSFFTHGATITFAPLVVYYFLVSVILSLFPVIGFHPSSVSDTITLLLLLIPALWITGSVLRSKEPYPTRKQVKSHLDEIAQLAFKSFAAK